MSEPTLTGFLLARIAEDEASVRNLPPWPQDGSVSTQSLTVHEYLKRLTPARVLAECDAKRRIVERHYTSDDVDEPGTCGYCGSYFPCHDLRALALPYADHPDYREEWRP